MQRIILHIDFDSFFASVEQQCDENLRGKPVGVTAANGRTCIIASSREAKRLGIRTGTRSYDAIKIYPQIKLVKADFFKYYDISKKFINIAKDYSPFVELFSIDEVFMDITPTAHLFGGTYQLIEKLKTRFKNELGEYITASVGISHNKLLAKLASGLNKPNGVTSITNENVFEVYKNAQLTDICGIGFRIEKRLHEIGVYTLMQLHSMPLGVLTAAFGNVEGNFLYNVGWAKDDSSVIPYTTFVPAKSVGRNYCLPHNEYDQRVILQNVYELSEEIGKTLRKTHMKAKKVGLSLRGERSKHQTKTSPLFMNTGQDIFQICKYFYDNWQWHEMVRMISVWTGNLHAENSVPVSIFEHDPKKAKIKEIIDLVNQKFGNHTIRNGFLLYADRLPNTPTGYTKKIE